MSHEIVYGIHTVQALLDTHPHRVLHLFLAVNTHSSRIQNLETLAATSDIRIDRVSRERLERLCNSPGHQGVVAFIQARAAAIVTRDRLMQLVQSLRNPWFLVLDQIEDPQNFGAIIRTAVAAGVTAIIRPTRNAVGVTSAVRKVACGTADLIPIFTAHNLSLTLRWLQAADVHIIGMSPDAQNVLYDAKLSQPLAVVIGAEKSGIRKLVCEQCDSLYRLPMSEGAQSLSASAATAATCFEIVRQRLMLNRAPA